MKTCVKCGHQKQLSEFYKTSNSKGPARSEREASCKVCFRAQVKSYKIKNRTEVLKKKKAHYYKNRTNILDEMATQYRKPKNPKWARHIKTRYGLSLDDYARLVEQSQGVCAICGKGMKPACIDHCHKTRKVRELLCRSCNTALGRFKDSPELCRKAAEYLEKHI